MRQSSRRERAWRRSSWRFRVLETVADAYQDMGDGKQAVKMLGLAMKAGLSRDAIADDPDIQPVLRALQK